jgi:sugar O-acyltransferase (sialic acid O-acetyltransferase NeuD family)
VARKRIAIVGAGGFAREVEWLVREIDPNGEAYEFVGYVVSDLSKLGEHDSRDRVCGDLDWLQGPNGLRVDAVAMGIGTPRPRLKVGDELRSRFPGLEFPALVHPNVRYDRGSSRIGDGAIVCAGVVGTVHVELGAFALINLSCTLGHESFVGRGSVLNPTVNLSGGVRIGDGVLVGTGAQVLQYVSVGDAATVGAGAVVTKDVAPGATVVGVPARPMPTR